MADINAERDVNSVFTIPILYTPDTCHVLNLWFLEPGQRSQHSNSLTTEKQWFDSREV
jgi:hypothetical protein